LTLVLFAASPKGTGLTVAAHASVLGGTLPFLIAILPQFLVNTLLLPVFLVVCRSFLDPVRVQLADK
jgi:hypothetical protein